MRTSVKEKKPKQKKTGDHWCTPQELYVEMCKKFNQGKLFDLDPCANGWSAKGCEYNAFVGMKECGECAVDFGTHPMLDGLSFGWNSFDSVFMNPPYSDWQRWIKYAFEQSQKGAYVVSLLMNASAEPAFHDYVMRGQIIEIRGRVQYLDPINNCKGSPTFGSIISVFAPYSDFNGHPPVSSWWPDLHQTRGASRRKKIVSA